MYITPISYSNNKYNYGTNLYAQPFKAKSRVSWQSIKVLNNVNCPYCGEVMLTHNQVNDYAIKASKLTGASLSKYLSKLEPHLKQNEKAVLCVIKEGIKKYPKLSLQAVLIQIFPRHLKKLEKTQCDILKQIEKESEKFSERDRILARKQVYTGLADIVTNEPGKHFKLKKFLDDFYLMKADFSNKRNFEKIEKLVHLMPTSHTNVNAFIVKYSRKDSKEIVEGLLHPSQMSREHVDPRSHGGGNEMYNIMPACCDCNSTRSNKPLDSMIGLRVNLPKFFLSLRNSISKKIPEHACVEVDKYFEDIQKSINSQLEDEIRFDNSRGCCR